MKGLSSAWPYRNRCSTIVVAMTVALFVLKTTGSAEEILVGARDIAKCGSRLKNAEATAKRLDEILSHHPEAVVFTLGDNAYRKGTTREFRECYDTTWGRHKAATRPAVGNHEYKTKGAHPYYKYFGEAAGDAARGYYSYDLGDWHIIVLNSVCQKVGGCDIESPQHRWLVDDLKTHRRPCTLAYAHHPVFSSGKHGGHKALRSIYETLYEYDVDVLVAGHEHNYERFAPQDPYGLYDPVRGIQQFIVGTGGRELRRIGKGRTNSVVRDNTSYGVLKLTLHPGSFEWDFIPVAGATFRDSGKGTCH